MSSTEPDHVLRDVDRVEIHERRWQATITVHHTDGTVDRTLVCANQMHSGLWLGDPDEHGEECW